MRLDGFCGEQSMKSLRGSKSLDIIFAGTQNRKSLGFAEASLIFDNTDGTLPIEYTEVTVTRKIYRSGETGYFINKVACRLKDVLELFMDTGIGKDGYSIIGQGKIDEILSNKSEDRRHIFEEAAGIVKYRARKEESEKKLERTKLNLLRINDILAEIESNIEPLKSQAEKAKKYLNLKEELKSVEIGLFLHNIEKYKASLGEIVKDEEIYNIFDTKKLLNRPPLVAINNISGVAGIAYWLNQYYNNTEETMISKKDPLVLYIKKWVDEQYEGGRITYITTSELISLVEQYHSQK